MGKRASEAATHQRSIHVRQTTWAAAKAQKVLEQRPVSAILEQLLRAYLGFPVSHGDEAESDSPAAVAYRTARALMKLARQQLILEARQEEHAGRLDDHERRLETVETLLGDSDRTITPAQAVRISQAVKAIAMKLGERSGRNEYGGVYGELHRRFQIPGYRELPAARFDEAME